MRAKQPVDSGYVERDGVRLSYEVFGNGPQTMVFVPAWTIGHSRVYKAMIPYFSERFRCITFDPRGNGKSDRPMTVEAYSMDAHVADLIAVMDATNAGNAIIVGYSASGMYTCVLAAYHPERVKAAVLLGTAASVGPGNPFATPQHFLAKKPDHEGWNKYDKDFWKKDYASFAAFFLGEAFCEPHATKQLEDAMSYAAETSGEILANTVEARLIPPSFDVSEAMFRKIKCPVLMIHGDDDRQQPYARGKVVAELTGAELVTVAGGGHALVGRIPAFVNTTVMDFLERRLPAGPAVPVRPDFAALVNEGETDMRAKMPAETGYVTRGGVKLHYEIYGTGPETLLFLQPWMIAHSRAFKAQLPYLSERFRCIAFDARGAGKSDRPERVEDYSLDDMVDDARAVLQHANVKQCTVIGFSYGSAVACALAAYDSHLINGAILVASAVTIGPGNPYMQPDHFLAKEPKYPDWAKYSRDYWLTNYADFVEFYVPKISSEPHSTKIREDLMAWAHENTGDVPAKTILGRLQKPKFDVSEAMYSRIKCPVLVIHGENDLLRPVEVAHVLAEATRGELVVMPKGDHIPFARHAAKMNTMIVDFIDRRIAKVQSSPRKAPRPTTGKRALYLSSPIGLGHGRRDIAIARELRKLHPDLAVDWLAQDPVTRLLAASGETIHPLSDRLANESRHIELESGEHELHAFQAIRRMDEVLAFNFMLFQDAVKHGDYDLVIADEAWDVDHYWHEHPELKKAKLAWLTDFVGFVPMSSGGAHEAFLATDYNAEMIGHVERHKSVRDRAIFVGSKEDIVPMSFGKDLPDMRDWVPKHFDFAGYIIGEHPSTFGTRADLRRQLGYRDGERVAIVTVGGSGVGAPLIRRFLQCVPMARAKMPDLRIIVVTGPRIDPASFGRHVGVEFRPFVPDLDRHLAACDVALVQGGLTTCMELVAARTPFVYFPLKNHFEQNFHVAHRLQRYGGGRRLDYDTGTPDIIADALVAALRSPEGSMSVEADGAARAARMISDIL